MDLPTAAPAPNFADYGLDLRLLAGLRELGYEHPTPVQRQAIPKALAGGDVAASASTGSGKTLAFLLPAWQRLLAAGGGGGGIRVLVLTPTRELAAQIHALCQRFAPHTGLSAALAVGGEDFMRQRRALRCRADTLVATPGRLLALIADGGADCGQLQTLVLDEADRMLDMGFGEAVLAIAGHCRPDRQTLLFSATLGAGVLAMAKPLLNAPALLAVDTPRAPPASIDSQMLLADDLAHKRKLLSWLLTHQQAQKALVFANTRVRATELYALLRTQGLAVGLLHGQMLPSARRQVMQAFTDGDIDAVLTTDLAARGLDIAGVGMVVNFDVPRNATLYLHRIGRTGRAGVAGAALTLVSGGEWNLYMGIQRYLRQTPQLRQIAGLGGHFQGPKRTKSSGKTVGAKKRPAAKAAKPQPKTKDRWRDQKNKGKRRKPSQPPP